MLAHLLLVSLSRATLYKNIASLSLSLSLTLHISLRLTDYEFRRNFRFSFSLSKTLKEKWTVNKDCAGLRCVPTNVCCWHIINLATSKAQGGRSLLLNNMAQGNADYEGQPRAVSRILWRSTMRPPKCVKNNRNASRQRVRNTQHNSYAITQLITQDYRVHKKITEYSTTRDGHENTIVHCKVHKTRGTARNTTWHNAQQSSRTRRINYQSSANQSYIAQHYVLQKVAINLK